MAEARSLEELAARLAEMSRDLLAQESVQDTLERIIDHTVDLVDGCEVAGIMAVRQKRVHTLAATGELVDRSDRVQDELGEGPCFDAARRHEQIYRIADLSETEGRWPQYVPRARELGIASMLGFRLYTEEDTLGALDLYSTRPHAFTERSELVGWLLASHAAVAFASARHDEQLRQAVSTRQEIGEALGIVMERHKLSEDQAFDRLRKISQDRNVKLRELAGQVTRTGDVPDTL